VRFPIVAFEGFFSSLVTELPKLGCGLTSGRCHDGSVLIASLTAALFVACPRGSGGSIVVAPEIHGRERGGEVGIVALETGKFCWAILRGYSESGAEHA